MEREGHGFTSFWATPLIRALLASSVVFACKSTSNPNGHARFVPEMEEEEEAGNDPALTLAGKTANGLPTESFFLKSVGLSRCLTLKGGRVIDIDCKDDMFKRFAAVPAEGPVVFSLKSDGTCMKVSQSKTGASFVALQSVCNDSNAQRWSIRPTGEEQFVFQSLSHPSLCLTAPRFLKAPFQVTTCSDTDYQKFLFVNPAAQP